MKNHRAVFGIVAALLAVLLPLQQARCAWMNLQPLAAAGGSATCSGHSCCASKSAPPPAHRPPTTAECCAQLPPAALTTHIVLPSHPLGASVVFALPAVAASPLLDSRAAPSQALDVGSPPLPDDLGAHGLRAPPLSV
jgi:hypothetical protein